MFESLNDGQSIYENLGTKTLQDGSNVELLYLAYISKFPISFHVLFAFLLRLNNNSQEKISLHVGSYSKPT